MITIEILGGLGNQLFQIFNLISYGLSNKIPFYFEYKETPVRGDRPFYWDNFLLSLKPFIKSTTQNNLPLYREEGFHYSQLIPYKQIGRPFKFYGYFQSYKYFRSKEKDIFKIIKLNKQIENIKSKYECICDFKNTISIHFRLGDYKHQPQNHPVMDLNYYKCAIQYIIKNTENNSWNILYFYEEQDSENVKDKINALKTQFQNISFISINTKIIDYEQILLMSLCQHNIIANSTFSWWGAYFNQNANKIVTYPNNWFGPGLGNNNMNDLFPENWIKINETTNSNTDSLHSNIISNNSVLIMTSSFHHKNKSGIERLLNSIGWKYKYGNQNDIRDFDIIYSPCSPIDTSRYPNKKFIFGPQFSVFPDNKICQINNINNNSFYIQPSNWAADVWKDMGAEKYLPIKTFPFPVDTDMFNVTDKSHNKVFIYFKRRKPEELQLIKECLQNNNIEYKIFDYVNGYKEEEYLTYLQESKYGIILDAHESQGFAIEEALSSNVPLLVWNTKYMSQEEGGNYSDILCSSISYWDERCGEFFYEKEDFEKTFDIFTHKLETYQPRQYILDNLSAEKCGNKFKNLIESIKTQ